MSPRSSTRLALLAAVLGSLVVAGCDIDTHKTATGVQKQAPETTSPTDPGKINAGGPGLEDRSSK